MNAKSIINELIVNRENTLSVKGLTHVIDPQSLGNPRIFVGTQPFYEWDKEREITFVITYGRYLNCEMLVYDKQIKGDKDYIIVKGKAKAKKALSELLNKYTKVN